MAGRRSRRDGGMVSAELALAIPAVLLVLALCLAAMGMVVDTLRCTEAARASARAAARGEPHAQVLVLAERAAPSGSAIEVDIGGGEVVVVIEAPQRALLPGVPAARAQVTVPLEPVVGVP